MMTMRSAGLAGGLSLLAGAVAAEPVPVPRGCELRATLVQTNCEMHLVMDCAQSPGALRVDVYGDGVFLGEQVHRGLAMTLWRRGGLMQEVDADPAVLAAAVGLAEGESLDFDIVRARRQLPQRRAEAREEDFAMSVRFVGQERQELAGGQRRLVLLFEETATARSGEGYDVIKAYDPAVGMVLTTAGTAREPGGAERDVSIGTAMVLTEGSKGFGEGVPPEGSGCVPE